jgi:hypothetical protein
VSIASGTDLGISLVLREPVSKLDPGGHLELGVHVAEVVLDGLDADDELAGDLPVGKPAGNQPGDGEFLRGEPSGITLPTPRGGEPTGGQLPLAALEAGERVEPIERVTGGP